MQKEQNFLEVHQIYKAYGSGDSRQEALKNVE